VSAILAMSGCAPAAETVPAVATPSLVLSAPRAAPGGPLDVTYTFTVPAGSAPLPADEWVFVHVVDERNQLLWTDDHAPSTPTQTWRADAPVTYTRTMFVPRGSTLGAVRIEVGLFSRCTKRERQTIARHAQAAELPAGTDLVREGEPGDALFLILEGEAVVRRDGHDVGRVGPGSHFGELAILDGAPRSATVVAATDVRVAVLGIRMFRTLLREFPGVALPSQRELWTSISPDPGLLFGLVPVEKPGSRKV